MNLITTGLLPPSLFSITNTTLLRYRKATRQELVVARGQMSSNCGDPAGKVGSIGERLKTEKKEEKSEVNENSGS